MRASPQPLLLSFAGAGQAESFTGNLSAAVEVGGDLWLGTDEGTSLARLSPSGAGAYGAHAGFAVGSCLELPGGDDEEIDVEGLTWHDGYLWLVGSHSSRRRKPGPSAPPRIPDASCGAGATRSPICSRTTPTSLPSWPSRARTTASMSRGSPPRTTVFFSVFGGRCFGATR